MHAACCRVAYMSGAAGLMDDIMDEGQTKVLSEDGSSDQMLVFALLGARDMRIAAHYLCSAEKTNIRGKPGRSVHLRVTDSIDYLIFPFFVGRFRFRPLSPSVTLHVRVVASCPFVNVFYRLLLYNTPINDTK
jgi:hypothetical protein